MTMREYKLHFEFWGLLTFLAVMLPNLIWFAVPAPDDKLRTDSITGAIDAADSVAAKACDDAPEDPIGPSIGNACNATLTHSTLTIPFVILPPGPPACQGCMTSKSARSRGPRRLPHPRYPAATALPRSHDSLRGRGRLPSDVRRSGAKPGAAH